MKKIKLSSIDVDNMTEDEIMYEKDKIDDMFDEKIINVGYDTIDIFYKMKIRGLNNKINNTV